MTALLRPDQPLVTKIVDIGVGGVVSPDIPVSSNGNPPPLTPIIPGGLAPGTIPAWHLPDWRFLRIGVRYVSGGPIANQAATIRVPQYFDRLAGDNPVFGYAGQRTVTWLFGAGTNGFQPFVADIPILGPWLDVTFNLGIAAPGSKIEITLTVHNGPSFHDSNLGVNDDRLYTLQAFHFGGAGTATGDLPIFSGWAWLQLTCLTSPFTMGFEIQQLFDAATIESRTFRLTQVSMPTGDFQGAIWLPPKWNRLSLANGAAAADYNVSLFPIRRGYAP